jgi:hypothetical protein
MEEDLWAESSDSPESDEESPELLSTRECL